MRFRSMRITNTVLLLASIRIAPSWAQSPFAVEVVEYAPAPGQFVNDVDFNDPFRALGPPVGGGTVDPNHESVVTLGGFGGYIVLRFDHVVEDHPLNPYGMDFIVFGNAHWVGNDPNRRWAEAATIEIAHDEDGNGMIDNGEMWYVIPGSHIVDPGAQWSMQVWDDNPNTETPPEFVEWIPAGQTGSWNTFGYLLPQTVFGGIVLQNPSLDGRTDAIYGYADLSPTLAQGDWDGDNVIDDPVAEPEDFYTRPDDPLTVGLSPGCGGGDAFDIAWAVHPATGEPAGPTGFDFIRITTAVNATLGFLGEKSAEIDGVSDAAADSFGDIDGDGDLDLRDAADLQHCYGAMLLNISPCAPLDEFGDGVIDEFDARRILKRLTGPHQ